MIEDLDPMSWGIVSTSELRDRKLTLSLDVYRLLPVCDIL